MMRGAATHLMLLAAGGVAFGVGLVLRDPGGQKPGRVLVDDSHSMEWEPSAHRLDEKYYGDFSTYSFSSAVEHLGRRFAVDVHAREAGLETVLDDYDVLLLKTPVTPYTRAELDAIDRFVAAGGGLIAIGDHTDLMGMNRRLNTVLDRFGMHLECDAVRAISNAYFVRWDPPTVGRHPALAGVSSVGFMTGCSVTCTGGAEAALVGRGVAGEPGDYINSSNFPRWANDPSSPAGAVPLIGAAEYGRGRVVVLTDSTPLSSFDYHKGGNDTLLLAVTEYVNRSATAFRMIPTLLALAGAAAAAWAAFRAGRGALARAIALGFAASVGGALLADAANAASHRAPPERRRAVRTTFVTEGCFAWFPPSLGGVGNLADEANLDSLFILAQRTGLECSQVQTMSDFVARDADVRVIANLQDRVGETLRQDLRRQVEDGGSLVLLDRAIPRDADSGSFRLLAALGVTIEKICPDHVHARGLRELPMPSSPFRVFAADCGRGRVFWAHVGDRLSRKELGHCFAVPDAEQRRTYDAVFRLFRAAAGDPRRPPDHGVLE